MKENKKRYYREGEVVWVKPKNSLGKIVELKINPEENIYKAVIEIKNRHDNPTVEEFNLWEINKDKREKFKKQSKNKPTILFAKVRDTAKIPSKNKEDAGYDIYADFEDEEIVFKPNETKLIPTGIASSVLDKWVLVVKERGSTGTKGMAVRAGVVDSSYRGEIFVALTNVNSKKLVITKNERIEGDVISHPYEKAIAQLLLLPVPDARIKEISYEDLSKIPSERGTGALGSSNK